MAGLGNTEVERIVKERVTAPPDLQAVVWQGMERLIPSVTLARSCLACWLLSDDRPPITGGLRLRLGAKVGFCPCLIIIGRAGKVIDAFSPA